MRDIPSVRTFLRTWLRFRMAEPVRFGAGVAAELLSRRRTVKVLLVSDQAVYTSEQQFAPLVAGRAALRERGIVFQRQLVRDALALPRGLLRCYDVVGLKLGFRTAPAEAERVSRALRGSMAPHAKLVYFDGDDDLCVQWPQLLPLFDLYIKKHCFRDRTEYLKDRIGKTNLTDYVARAHGVSFAGDIIPAGAAVAPDQLAKIVAGWNVGLDDKIRQLAGRGAAPRSSSKDIDVVCRATVSRESWIYPLRSAVIPRIRALEPEFRVLTPEQRVTQEVYYEEMLRSRACVSPFGYGEICWRDFEAVLCGSVLVKPDMSHVETHPDIFVANETYVPVRWDYADLTEVLRRLLSDPARCDRIRANAEAALRSWLDGDAALRAFAGLLGSAGAPVAAGPATVH